MHIYTGNGKGKTSAALGLVVRAAGRGMRVVLAQFLKGRDTGELHSLRLLPGVTVLRCTKEIGFYATSGAEDRAEIARLNAEVLAEAHRLAMGGQCELMVLDELCAAYRLGILDTALADELVLHRPRHMELILTGRNPPARYLQAADYVTECVKRKHPFDSGVPAREGIEY